MPDLLSKLNRTTKIKVIEPREIFMTLPKKDRQYQYPRDVQSEVWKKWFNIRNNRNNIIKMNTGSGKTVVGLMILQSCLNEDIGPAVYVVPDKYLVEQVCQEAEKLGIAAVTKRDDYLYAENKAILVMPIHALVNGRSVFGMRSSNNYPIGSVLLDDVHACLETISEQFSIKIPANHGLYQKIVDLFCESWKNYNSNSYTNIIMAKDPQKRMLIPFWLWQEKQAEIYQLLSLYNNASDENQEIFFSLPLIEDCLATCNCIITSKRIEITPAGISIDKIKSFENARRRIFMSATLSDDSVFVSVLGMNGNDVTSIITPESANDIGDRLILFPKHLNNTLTDEQIKEKLVCISEVHNVVVIVPSRERARFWESDASCTVTRENIKNAVGRLKQNHCGLVVFVNRYDGIDLPDNACRVLVLDGLPPLKCEYDKYILSVDPSSQILLRDQVQRIEQGMGRGVRSNSDSCCIILMGEQLVDVLIRNKGISYFSNATTEQYKLSKELWDLLRQEDNSPSVDSIFELLSYSLDRNEQWIEMSKERLSRVSYADSPTYDETSLMLRRAYEYSCSRQWQKSAEEIQKAVYINANNSSTKGYLLQIQAAYTNFTDKSKAQQILQAGHNLNRAILAPLDGIQYEKVINNKSQAVAINEYLSQKFSNQNEYVIFVNALIERLHFSPDADEFEAAFQDLGTVLGFISTRPDKETGGQGPDNLWAMGNGKYLVVECKTGSVVDTISKDYCNQLGGSMRWFESEYGKEYTAIPIMVHPSTTIDSLATPVSGMRIITQDRLELLKHRLKDFSIASSQVDNWLKYERIQTLLQNYKLQHQDIIQSYTVLIKT